MVILIFFLVPESELAVKLALLLLLLFGGVFLLFLFKKQPRKQKVEVLSSGIELSGKKGKMKVEWRDISEIDYHGRNGVMRLQAIKIICRKQVEPILIYYSFYENSNEIAQLIRKGFNSYRNQEVFDFDLFSPVVLERIQKDEARFEEYNYISRMPIFSIRTYFPLMGLMLIYAILTAKSNSISGIVVVSCLALFVSSLAFIAMAKVGVSTNYLRIENLYFPLGKTFRLNRIKEVFIERPHGRSPINIRVITEDDNYKSFLVDNFYTGDWIKLESLLEERGVKTNSSITH